MNVRITEYRNLYCTVNDLLRKGRGFFRPKSEIPNEQESVDKERLEAQC